MHLRANKVNPSGNPLDMSTLSEASAPLLGSNSQQQYQQQQQYNYRPPVLSNPGDSKALSSSSSASAASPAYVAKPDDDELHFTVSDNLPVCPPNVFNQRDLFDQINKGGGTPECSPTNCCWSTVCCFTGIGACYVVGKMVLIKEGEYGFTMENGVPGILLPGRYFLSNPLTSVLRVCSQGDDLIQAGPITIARIPRGMLGLAMNGSQPEILKPGTHLRNSAAFKFHGMKRANEDMEFGPIKIFTVRTGVARACYENGRVKIYKEGRYAVNSASFVVASLVNTQQQNLRFEKHPVLLDGGISMLVEGLLTYQVVDVELLTNQLGADELLHSIKDVTKAELARVFAGLHLEQISQAAFDESEFKEGGPKDQADEKEQAAVDGLLGKQTATHEGETRMWICQQVIKFVTPITRSWGVHVINFQLESTKIADETYAKEYEAASLAMAKAKANLRAAQAQNQIVLTSARAQANAIKIEAEGKKAAVVIQAQGEAEARKIEGESRNEAARMMQDEFAKQYAMAGQQVEFARALKASSVTVLASSGLAQPILAQPMLGGHEKK